MQRHHEVIDGISEISLRLVYVEKVLPMRCVRSLTYYCILGMDFLKLFELDLDFDNNCWRTAGADNFVAFNRKLDSFDLASVSGLA